MYITENKASVSICEKSIESCQLVFFVAGNIVFLHESAPGERQGTVDFVYHRCQTMLVAWCSCIHFKIPGPTRIDGYKRILFTLLGFGVCCVG